MIRLFLQLLQHSFSGRAILQSKLGDDAAEFVRFGVGHLVERDSQPQQKLMEPTIELTY